MSDLPLSLPAALDPAFVDALDPPGKLAAALEALGPGRRPGRSVVDATAGRSSGAPGGGRPRHPCGASRRPLRLDAADASVDVVLGLWSSFRGVVPPEIAEVDRVLRPGGRHLVVHEYGRDDVSRLVGDRPEYGAWSQRTGPFLTGGFRVRVVHCFWEFATPEATGGVPVRRVRRAGARRGGDAEAPAALVERRGLPSVPPVNASTDPPATPARPRRPAAAATGPGPHHAPAGGRAADPGRLHRLRPVGRRDRQRRPDPAACRGVAVTGASFAALAIGALAGMWRAASRLAGGRSFALALVAGLCALAAIGCFAVTALLMLVWNT